MMKRLLVLALAMAVVALASDDAMNNQNMDLDLEDARQHDLTSTNARYVKIAGGKKLAKQYGKKVTGPSQSVQNGQQHANRINKMTTKKMISPDIRKGIENIPFFRTAQGMQAKATRKFTAEQYMARFSISPDVTVLQNGSEYTTVNGAKMPVALVPKKPFAGFAPCRGPDGDSPASAHWDSTTKCCTITACANCPKHIDCDSNVGCVQCQDWAPTPTPPKHILFPKSSELGEVAQLDSEEEAGVGRRPTGSYNNYADYSFSYSAGMGNRAGNDEEEEDDLGEA